MYPGFHTESALDVAKRFVIVLAVFAAITGACALGSRPAGSAATDHDDIAAAAACLRSEEVANRASEENDTRARRPSVKPRRQDVALNCARFEV